MVKKDIKKSISEDDGDTHIVNENGKRPAEPNNDGKKRLKTKSLYRQPTVKELNRLQETESLFNSNLFRLQIEEVLQEVKVKEKNVKRFQEWYTNFKTYLSSVPEDNTEYDLSTPTLSKKLKVKLPIGDELQHVKVMFKYHKFQNVEIVGSYALGSLINSKLIVNLQIAVPVETYTKNDSINYKYHMKRAAYLAILASHLHKSDIIEDIKYTLLNGCQAKPVIDLKPAGKLGNHLSVRLNLVCEAEAYKLHRFSPIRNNIRESWLFSTDQDNTEVGPSTPYYNSSILMDLTAEANHNFLQTIFMNSDNLKQAIILLKIWLRQRNLKVSGHTISMYVAYLVQLKRINNIMSSYQIVRNIWIALKTSEWDTKGVSLHKGDDSPPIGEFLQHFPVVFLDTTGYYNICWQMCKGTYCALKRESALAVDMLDHPKINSFIPLFMTRMLPLMQFDVILRFKNMQKLKQSVHKRAPKQSRLNYGLDTLALVTDTLYALLEKCLGNRTDLILQLTDADLSWPVKRSVEKAKKDGLEEKLSFGFVLNPENASNIVDRGPPANLPEAEEFRAFWGDKCELRRFQDGAITESVVWRAGRLADRRLLLKQVLDYMLHLKFGMSSNQLYHVCDQLARTIPCGSEETSAVVLQTFDELRRDMRSLTQLPLDVSAVYGVSPVFSYGEPKPPTRVSRLLPPPPGPRPAPPGLRPPPVAPPGALRRIKKAAVPSYVPVSCAVLELGHSGKWPGDIEAFRCLKAAFHLQIAERLTKQYSLPTQAYPTHIDVLKNGLVFRLQIVHPKEITLLRREIENGVVKFKESDDSLTLQRDTVLLPRIRGALHGLHHKYPAYGGAVCLLKRWLSAHLLSLPSALPDLLTASIFLRPQPYTPPRLPDVAFLRVLRLLAETDWSNHVVMLDFNDDMTREEISEMERKISESVDRPAMCVATSYDGASAPASAPAPAPAPAPAWGVRDRAAVCRAQALAKATLAYVHTNLMDDMNDDLMSAFVPSMKGYDVLIYLHKRLVPYAGHASTYDTSDDDLAEDIPVVEFNPVEKYLDELRNAYSEFAIFFHDGYGGDVVAVLWKPDVTEIKDFQIANAHALKPVIEDGETKYKVNLDAIVEDFRILGAGLVRDVVVQTKY